MQVKESNATLLSKLKKEWRFLLELGKENKKRFEISEFDTFQRLVSANLVHVLFDDNSIVFEGLTRDGKKLCEALDIYLDGETRMVPILLFDQEGYPLQVFTTMEEAANQLGISEKSAKFYLETGGVSVSGQKLKLITE
ncbi:hypothetical protein [Listeria newyorkensis]|uniref:Uncharacterized protein n=1 Tax=Listeria newyorkensis TaxID=1497681 RepID=A0A841YZN8_9LIST|nr:hypothetical protein [Listeria newyorkensis]MBC1458083.1 hypothetical protein [Listeria newyorkensis]